MIAVIVLLIFILLAILFILYSYFVRTCTLRKKRMEVYKKYYIAHRGLFDNKDIPENSMMAFKKAVEHNFGIELDVQLTSDDKLVVFHDKTLKRICKDKRVLHKLSYREVNELFLLNTDEKIPLLENVLRFVSGRVPLVIEIKPEGDFLKTSELANEMLLKYKGKYCIESFHPLVLKWFKENSPDTLRGQLSTVYTQKILNKPWWIRFLLNNMMFNFITKPDFIAYNHKHSNRLTYKLCRHIYKPFSFAWTIRSQKELDSSKEIFDSFIFDSFVPTKNKN